MCVLYLRANTVVFGIDKRIWYQDVKENLFIKLNCIKCNPSPQLSNPPESNYPCPTLPRHPDCTIFNHPLSTFFHPTPAFPWVVQSTNAIFRKCSPCWSLHLSLRMTRMQGSPGLSRTVSRNFPTTWAPKLNVCRKMLKKKTGQSVRKREREEGKIKENNDKRLTPVRNRGAHTNTHTRGGESEDFLRLSSKGQYIAGATKVTKPPIHSAFVYV